VNPQIYQIHNGSSRIRNLKMKKRLNFFFFLKTPQNIPPRPLHILGAPVQSPAHPHRVNSGMQPEKKAWKNLVQNIKARWLCLKIQFLSTERSEIIIKLDPYVTIWPYPGLKSFFSTHPVFWTDKTRDHPLEHNETDICNILTD